MDDVLVSDALSEEEDEQIDDYYCDALDLVHNRVSVA